MFKRILVALDGSPASNAGLHAALDLAIDQQATLLAVHVVDDGALPIDLDGSVYPPDFVDAYHVAAEIGRKILERAATIARGRGISIEPVVPRSKGHTVADAIVGQARKRKADVIVLGTHGRRGLKRVLMGSDAEEVVRLATVPVLLVRGTYRAARKSRKPAVDAPHTTRPSATRPRAVPART